MPDEKRPPPPVSAFVSPEGIAVLTAAGATAALASLPLVLVPGMLAYGILTYLRIERWKELHARARFAPVLPALDGLLPQHAARVTRAVALERQILTEIAKADPDHQALLLPNIDRVRGLVMSSSVLTRRLQDIEVHLRSDDPRRVAAVARDLEQRMAATTDPSARAGYTRALEQQREKVRISGELKARADRIDAQLATIQLTLETVVGQILRIKSAEASSASDASERVAEALQALSIDVDALAETVEETAVDERLFGSKGTST